MNEQSSKEDFNDSVNPEKAEPRIDHSHDDIMARMKIMDELSKNPVELNEVRKMRDEYEQRINEKYNNRVKQDVLYNMGKGRGLHMEGRHSDLTEIRGTQDQIDRNKTADKASEFYQEHQSISHDFDKSKDKTKDRGPEKEI